MVVGAWWRSAKRVHCYMSSYSCLSDFEYVCRTGFHQWSFSTSEMTGRNAQARLSARRCLMLLINGQRLGYWDYASIHTLVIRRKRSAIYVVSSPVPAKRTERRSGSKTSRQTQVPINSTLSSVSFFRSSVDRDKLLIPRLKAI